MIICLIAGLIKLTLSKFVYVIVKVIQCLPDPLSICTKKYKSKSNIEMLWDYQKM